MPDTWYIRKDGSVESGSEGPLSAAELKARVTDGRLRPDSVVSPNGQDWVPAAEVAGLFLPRSEPPVPAVRLSGVSKRFDQDRPAMLQIDRWELAVGEHIALAGPSGLGKTTLLNLLAGLLSPDTGRIEIAGTDITALSSSARDRFRGRSVGYGFQNFNLVQGLSAEANVLLAMRFGSLPRVQHAARARELLSRVGLAEHAHKRPAELSVGQQQRVAVARALANRPALVLAAEPTANLDTDNAAAAVELLRSTCTEVAATLIVVSHVPELLARFSRVLDIRDFKPKPPRLSEAQT